MATDYLADVEVNGQRVGPDGLAMTLASSVQLSTFLFSSAENSNAW